MSAKREKRFETFAPAVRLRAGRPGSQYFRAQFYFWQSSETTIISLPCALEETS
jgi:hypothetical protein